MSLDIFSFTNFFSISFLLHKCQVIHLHPVVLPEVGGVELQLIRLFLLLLFPNQNDRVITVSSYL